MYFPVKCSWILVILDIIQVRACGHSMVKLVSKSDAVKLVSTSDAVRLKIKAVMFAVTAVHIAACM